MTLRPRRLAGFQVRASALAVAGACSRGPIAVGRVDAEPVAHTTNAAANGDARPAHDSSAEGWLANSDTDAAPAAPETALTPIPADPLFTNLSVPGFPDAVVSLPNGTTTPRPILIVLHGSGDRPDWNCDAWRHITGAQGFVLCPRGQYVPSESTKDDRRYTHRGGAFLRDHVRAAIDALGARFGAHVDADRPIAAGFSLGATEIGQLAIDDPAHFQRVAQLEGGHGVWTAATALGFSTRGGLRVLFGCGSKWCVPLAKSAAARLGKGGVEARVVYADVGHTNDRPLQQAIIGELGWFLEGDPRWASAAEPRR